MRANAEQFAYRKVSTRSFEAVLVGCPPPLVSDKSVSDLHTPAGVTFSDIIRCHADEAQNEETVPRKDSAHLRMMSSLSIAMTSLLPDVEGDRARGVH